MNLFVCAQNSLYYAWTTNGNTGNKLFPEVNNEVIISNIIITDCSPEEIFESLEDLVGYINLKKDRSLKLVSKSKSRAIYSGEFSFGTQNWGIDFWGTPLFNVNKSATKVKFILSIEAIQGKFKYSLTDFETNRNTIKGEAKNDGQPNVIHWQRVNSLIKERDLYKAENPDNRKTKEVIYDYNAQINYENYLYGNEFFMIDQFSKSLDGLNCNSTDFMESQFELMSEDAEIGYPNLYTLSNFTHRDDGMYTMTFINDVKTDSDIVNIHHKPKDSSFLMGKGNNVYVTSGEHIYEIAGAQELIKQISIDGFWNVVNDIKEADFVITYNVNLEGRDKGYIVFSNTDRTTSIPMFYKSSNESVRDNREVARSIYLSNLTKLQKSIEKKVNLKAFESFYK